MQNDKTFNSTYEQLWPELNSGNKVHSDTMNTRYESRNTLIQSTQLNDIQQSSMNLTAEFEKSLSCNQNNADFTVNPTTSNKSIIFKQPLLLGDKPSRLSYTGNFPSFPNQVSDSNYCNEIYNKHENEVWKLEHFLDNTQPLPTTASIDSSHQALNKKPLISQNTELQHNQKTRKHNKQNKGLKTTIRPNIEVQDKKTEFSLEQTAANFPELNPLKRQKNNKNKNSSIKQHNNSESLNIPHNNRVAKSWKPKVKDPIFINLDQALQSLPEKNKPDLKKIPPATHQVPPLPANILDSDKPRQRKGKVRPDKLKKPSKLKERILAIRNEKHNSSSDGSEIQTTGIFDELNQRVSRLLNCETTEENGNVIEVKESASKICELERNFSTDETLLTPKCETKEEACQSVNFHSRKFREYCTNCITEEIVANVCALLEKVAQFQDRLFAQNPLKASAKRRYVAGIHQTNKYLNVKKVKILVIAPDLEKSPGKGGLDEKITNMIKEAKSQEILCVFGPNRKLLGRTVRKNALVACIAVLSYEGAEEQFTKVTESLSVARLKYQSLSQQHPQSFVQVQDEKREAIPILEVEEDFQQEDVTSTLLAKLRDNISPACQLLQAINPRDWCGD